MKAKKRNRPRRFFGRRSTVWTAEAWLYEHGEEKALREAKRAIRIALKDDDEEDLAMFCALFVRLREILL